MRARSRLAAPCVVESSGNPFYLLRRCLGHQRLRFEEMRRVGTGPWLELLHTSAEHFRCIEIPGCISGELVHRPEQSRRGAMCAPRVQEVPVQVVLEELVERT